MERVSSAAVSDALLSALPGSVYVVSAAGTVVEVLDAPGGIGFDAEDPGALSGATLGDVLPSTAAELVADTVGSALATGEERTVEYVASTGGAQRRFEGRAVPLDGAEELVILAVRDAGDPEDPAPGVLRRAFERAPVGLTVSGPRSEDLPMEYVNEGFTEITGYDRSEARGRNCRFLQGEDTREGSVDPLREAIEAGEVATTELRNYRADGAEFWNRVSVAPIDDGDDPRYVGFQQNHGRTGARGDDPRGRTEVPQPDRADHRRVLRPRRRVADHVPERRRRRATRPYGPARSSERTSGRRSRRSRGRKSRTRSAPRWRRATSAGARSTSSHSMAG